VSQENVIKFWVALLPRNFPTRTAFEGFLSRKETVL